MGLVGFYRKFIPNFSEIAVPLTEATRDRAPVKVNWTPQCEAAFEELKAKLCAQPACILPDFSKVFVLRTDASNTGLGAILIQDHGHGDQTIACGSRKLNQAERNYSTIQLHAVSNSMLTKTFHSINNKSRFEIKTLNLEQR